MNQVRKYALAYLERKITTEDFLDWLADATSPVVEINLSQAEKTLASDIELRAAEFTGEHISEARFRVLLQELVSDTNVIRGRTRVLNCRILLALQTFYRL